MGILSMALKALFLSTFVCATCLSLAVSSASAQSPSIMLAEQKIKAGLAYSFLKNTSWPQDLKGTLKLCFFGSDLFDGYLDPLEGRMVQELTITIEQIHEVPESAKCNVVFIHRDEARSLPTLFDFLEGKPVLTVSDSNDFATSGGMLEFYRENNHVKLFVNAKAVGKAGLRIHGSLLKLATIVSGELD